MDERVEEVKAIDRISPIRKVALAKPRRGRGEVMYQLNQHHKSQNPKRKNLITKKTPDVSEPTDSGVAFNSNDFVKELKKRIAFDRAMIIGD
ncbi:conserved hypothetical protein [Candidatus Desulfosporosinus infrequens]|uniref:Uncharacterized protein n=1 Tax=Candidatus Desulfosporosinus infrequens TaxID=2043169 RepID=A0A2U3LF65_9FIRM|nr:conserved hypothetical protein [Candidatus Desulfosporosinus infrequens]